MDIHSRISALAEEKFDDAVSLLGQLVSVPSVLSEDTAEGAPYGSECRRALDTASSLLEKDGFYVREFDGHAITAAFDDREAELGILAHLDVVPAGNGWTSDPFTLTDRDGCLFGRGAIDDKGPAAAVITAMKIVRELGLPIKKNCRLILGSNEENGSTDMEYYSEKEAFPPMLFTPDGSFPIISIEKGMIRYDMKRENADGERMLVSAHGGDVYNAVPDHAEAVVSGVSISEAEKAIKSLDSKVLFSVENAGDNTICITASGKCVHASTPEGGINAVTGMITLLSKLDLTVSDSLKTIAELFPYGETDGTHAGVKMSDEKSGALTLVLSRFDCGAEGICTGTDIRFPVCGKGSNIASVLRSCAEKAGMKGEAVIISEPHCADEDSDFIRTLLSVYESVTGEKGECLAIGGGTYVHDTENGVAFGAEHHDRDNRMHGADEFITKEELKEDIIIYAETIFRLCCE